MVYWGYMKEKDKGAVLLGRKSAKKRFKGKTKKQISEMMRALRARRIDKTTIPRGNE